MGVQTSSLFCITRIGLCTSLFGWWAKQANCCTCTQLSSCIDDLYYFLSVLLFLISLHTFNVSSSQDELKMNGCLSNGFYVSIDMSLKAYIFYLNARTSLEERLKLEESSGMLSLADTAIGSKQLTFTLKKVSTSSSLIQHSRWTYIRLYH